MLQRLHVLQLRLGAAKYIFFLMVKGAIFMLYIFYHNKKEIAQVSESKLVDSRDWGKWRDGVIANVY